MHTQLIKNELLREITILLFSNSDERQNVKKQLMFIQKSVQEIEKKQAKMYSDFSVKLDALTKAVEELQGKRVQTSEQVDRLRPPPARNPQELEAMVRHESFVSVPIAVWKTI